MKLTDRADYNVQEQCEKLPLYMYCIVCIELQFCIGQWLKYAHNFCSFAGVSHSLCSNPKMPIWNASFRKVPCFQSDAYIDTHSIFFVNTKVSAAHSNL